VAAPQVQLPPWYLEGFAARPEPGDGAPHVWSYRSWIGEWKRSPVRRPAGAEHHFNDVDEGALDRIRALEEELLALEGAVVPLLRETIPARRPFSPSDRAALARFVALVAVRTAKGAGDLDPAEARAGVDAMAKLVGDMGWVFWTTAGDAYLVTSSTPFNAVLPQRDRIAAGFALTEPSVEVTMPLGRRVALHGTWRRKGELWRTAGEDAHLELNGRTCQGARGFLVSPEAALPG
jgi:hypothetical protein